MRISPTEETESLTVRDYKFEPIEVNMDQVCRSLTTGQHVEVHWPGEKKTFGGKITAIQGSALMLAYHDGTEGYAHLANNGVIVEGRRPDMRDLDGIDLVLCTTCGLGDTRASGKLIMCDKAEQCELGVHARCAGLGKVPHGSLLCTAHAKEMVCKHESHILPASPLSH